MDKKRTFVAAAAYDPCVDATDHRLLDLLRANGRATLAELGGEVGLSSPAVKRRIDRLVERGLVTRRTDPNDGRGIFVGMNPAGLTRVDAAITRLVDAEAELLATLSASEQASLATLLRKLSLGFD